MVSIAKSRVDPRDDLDRMVVAALFRHVLLSGPIDASLPAVIFQHRRLRARGRLLDALLSRGSDEVPDKLRKEMQKLVRDWATADFDDAFKPAAAFEIRCAREHDLVEARESGDSEKLLAVLERDYRRRVIEEFGKIELRGIQTSHWDPPDLDTVYVPLHLEAPPEVTADKDGKQTVILFRQRLTVPEVLTDHRHVLIVGAPGSGKSTLVSYMATRAAAQKLGPEWNDLLPLILTVRSFKGHSLTVENISIHTGCDSGLVRQALERQRALVFLDGLDEAPEDLRGQLIESLHSLVKRYPEVYLLATSRPAGAPGEIERRVHGLKPFRLAELQRQEVDEFISKWCLAAERSVRKDLAQDDREAIRAADDLRQRLSRSYSVQRIAVNPLLVTILCVVHRFLGSSIPDHRFTLYDKCTDALLYEWDRAKFPEGSAVGYLDASAKRQLLKGVARKIHSAHAAEIAEEDAVQHFEQILPELGRPVEDSKRIMAEIRDRSGLLVERRPGFFSFSHLTFQEYLCALDFVDTKDLDELTRHYAETWWHEVIVLAAGGPGASGERIARRLLSKKQAAAVFLAAQCLETAPSMPLEVRERIEAEIQKLVPPQDYLEVESLIALGVVSAPALAKLLQTEDDSKSMFYCLWALKDIDYEPAVPAIAKCVGDSRSTNHAMRFVNDEAIIDWAPSIGGFSCYILALKAIESDTARTALRQTFPRLAAHEREVMRQILATIYRDEIRFRKILEEVDPGTSRPKRARSTA